MTLSDQPSSPCRSGRNDDNSDHHNNDREVGPHEYTYAPLTVDFHTNENKNRSNDADYLNELEAEYFRLKEELEAVQRESLKQEEIGATLEQECADLQEQIAESQRKEKEQRKMVKKLHAENEEIQRMTDKKIEERDALKIETEQIIAERDNLQKKLEALTNNKGISSILMKLEGECFSVLYPSKSIVSRRLLTSIIFASHLDDSPQPRQRTRSNESRTQAIECNS